MTIRPRRSVLYMPGSNARAMEKARTLPVDAVILDLEDSVAPEAKEAARQQVLDAVTAGGFGAREVFVRINGLDTPWWIEEISDVAARQGRTRFSCRKSRARSTSRRWRSGWLNISADHRIRVWAMIETPLAVLQGTRDRRRRAGFGDAARRLRDGHERYRQGDARTNRAGPGRRCCPG